MRMLSKVTFILVLMTATAAASAEGDTGEGSHEKKNRRVDAINIRKIKGQHKPGGKGGRKGGGSVVPPGKCLDSSNLCGGASSEDSVCDENIPTEPLDVLIIGSGLAGLGAAREIEIYNREYGKQKGFKKYKVLEAESKYSPRFLCGRMIAAHWIHGGEGNPITEMMREQTNRGYDELRYDVQKFDNVKHYKLTGISKYREKPDNVIKKERTRWQSVYDCVNQKATNYWRAANKCENNPTRSGCPPPDRGLGVALQHCYKKKAVNPDIDREWFKFDFEYAQAPSATSTEGLPEDTYEVFQKKDWFVSDHDYGTDEISKREYRDYCIDKCVCGGTTVTEIDWTMTEDPKNVVEVTAGAKTYYAMQVISTVSVGVLAQNLITFNPDITAKLDDMKVVYTYDDGTGYHSMPLYYEILFQFSDAIWEKFGDDVKYQFINIDFNGNYSDPPYSNPRGKCRWWQNYDTNRPNKFYYGSHMLVCTLVTEDVEETGISNPNLNPTQTTNIVMDLLHRSIGKVYDLGSLNDCTRCNPPGCDIFETTSSGAYKVPGGNDCLYRFFNDKYDTKWHGSYENWNWPSNKVGTRKQFRSFFSPLKESSTSKEVVRFAGSATCYNYWGYTHGALYSGIREGKEALRFLGVSESDLPETPEYCTSEP